MTNTNLELLECMIGGLQEIAADIGADRNIPPGLIAEAFNIRNRISKFKKDLKEVTDEAD